MVDSPDMFLCLELCVRMQMNALFLSCPSLGHQGSGRYYHWVLAPKAAPFCGLNLAVAHGIEPCGGPLSHST